MRMRAACSAGIVCSVLLEMSIVLAAPLPPASAAEGTPARKTVSAFEQNKRLGRGLNIIGYDPLWRSRDRARFQDRHFRLIEEAGFNHVRINLHPWRDGKIDAENRLQQDWLETLDWAVRQASTHKLAVILDLHEYDAMGRRPEENRQRFLATWRQLAERYADAPNEVLFEILNEPNKKLTPQLWNEYAREALKIIRATNPTRTVIVGPAFWNSVDYLDKLVLPESDRNLIVTVHYYKPMEFTHQGASWAGQRDKVGIPWNGTAADREPIQRDFAKVQRWAEKYDRPIYVGEFGAYDKADMPSRARYIGFVAREAERRGWSWAYWQFDGDFIAFDMRTQQWVKPILDALISPQKGGSSIPDKPSSQRTSRPSAKPKPEAPLVSPEVHADGRITFRLRAPKAEKVSVICEAVGAQPMAKECRRRLESHGGAGPSGYLRRFFRRGRAADHRSGQPERVRQPAGLAGLRRSARSGRAPAVRRVAQRAARHGDHPLVHLEGNGEPPPGSCLRPPRLPARDRETLSGALFAPWLRG